MISSAARTLARVLCVGLISCSFVHAACPVNRVTVKGRVEHAPRNASVRVQLVYSKDQLGESGETTVENEMFNIPVAFLTQSRKPILIGSVREKCDRKPSSVVVTLVEGDQEYDRVSLDLGTDFKMRDPTPYTYTAATAEYVLRSQVVLSGPR